MMELKKYNANHTKVLKINQIVHTVSETHRFDKDKLIAINTSDVENGVMGSGTLTSVDELKGQFKKTIVKDDILFSEIRPANRRFAKVTTEDTKDYVVSTKLMVLRKYNEDVDLEYFYYCLTNQPFLDILQRRAENRIGSFPQITFDLLSEYAFPIPPINEQKRISSVISTLDKKIALNRAINQNLEAMAKQLYDYWFVQFDFPDENGRPYKSSGGKMVWNEKLKREIPKGWNVLKLGEHCSFNKRTSNGYFNHPILYLDTSNITNNTIDELQFLNPSSDIIPSRARRLVQEGDIVYSTVRPNLKHFGIIMNPDYNMVVSTGFAVITANWSAYRYFIYQFLIQAATIENLSTIAQSAVSAYPSINTSDIENLDLVVPPDSMIEKYAKTACRLYLQIDTNYKEIKSLTKQRDELLPLLMNGQVSVNSDLSVYKKRRGKIPFSILNDVSDI